MTAPSRRPAHRSTFPLRVRLARGRVVHAAYTHRMFVEGAGQAACGEIFEAADQQLPAEAGVTCAHCLRVSTVKEGQK